MGIFDKFKIGFKKSSSAFTSGLKEIIVKKEINDENFEEIVLKSNQPVLVDFWAAWCGPCRMVGPIIDEISNDYAGKAIVGKVDIDSNQQYAAQFGVRNIPTVLIFKDGELVDRKVGVSSKNDYAAALDALI